MTQDDVLEMARQAGFETMLRKGKILGFDRDGDYTEELEAFAKLVEAKAKAEEREACAKVCESQPMRQDIDVRDQCAEAIRARGEK